MQVNREEMVKKTVGQWGIGLLVLGLVSLSGNAAQAQLTSFTASGADVAAITPTVNDFRNTLGTNNGVGGSFTSGRREINWDGVPAAFSDPNFLPGNFFNVNSPRGALFSTPGTGFKVSDNASGGNGVPVRFGFPDELSTFSPQKLFAPIGSLITDVTFRVPGTGTVATVSGFGSTFTDVEEPGLTTLDFFDLSNALIGTVVVPTSVSAGQSFGGATSTVPIARVRITTGSAPLLGNGDIGNSRGDLVVMDDFIYAEPQGITAPEPGTFALMGMAGLSVCGWRLRKRRVAGK